MKQELVIYITSTCECGHEYMEALYIADATFSIGQSPDIIFDTLKIQLRGPAPITFTGRVSKADITDVQIKRDPVFHFVCPRCGRDLLFATQEEESK